jgi:hypothetical protein
MSVQAEIAFLESVLEHTLVLEEGLLTEQGVTNYVGRICEGLEAANYGFKAEFTLGQVIEALEFILEHDEGLSPAMEGFFSKALGAVKGAIAGGAAKVADAHHKYWYDSHKKQASKAYDKATQGEFSRKANEKYIKHSQKAAQHQLHADPKGYRADTIRQVGDNSPVHGSRDAARKNIYTGRQMSLALQQTKPLAPKTAAAKKLLKPSATPDMQTNAGSPVRAARRAAAK